MPHNITKREKTFAIFTICVLLLSLIYNFVVEPLTERWNFLKKEIREKEALLMKHNRILRNKERIEKQHTVYSAYFKKEVLTPEEESASALSSIEKLARTSSVRITNIKPLSTKNFENYNKYTFRVATESKIGELTKFIYDLQTSGELLKIERMVLRAKERQPNVIKTVLHITRVSLF